MMLTYYNDNNKECYESYSLCCVGEYKTLVSA